MKKGGHSSINRGEGLMTVDFDDNVSLAEKEGASMAGRGGSAWDKRSRMDGAEVVVGQRKQDSGALQGRSTGEREQRRTLYENIDVVVEDRPLLGARSLTVKQSMEVIGGGP
ncbi:hypothetical protein BHM03_00057193 [Ensete ventricosum]|nr:hypothetical protein BHM03_00057193 [Ensete ventricosum]